METLFLIAHPVRWRLIEHLLALRSVSGFDDLDLDGREIDIGAEQQPTWAEEDEERCWCIRRTREMTVI